MILFKKENIKWGIVFLAALLYLFFYYSAFKPHTLDKYFLPAPLFLDRLIFTSNPLETKALIFLNWSYPGEILLLAAMLITVLRFIRPITRNV